MLALRYAGLLALTLWVGGLLALGAIGAPAIFDVLAARHVAGDRVLAGAIFGEILGRFHLLAYVCGVVLLGTLLVRGIMLLATAYSGLIVSAKIARTQAEIGAAPSSLPEGDPRRAAFGRLHAMSTGLAAVPILGGLFLLFRELKD